ncbi:MAG: TlyA family RNA methyltransferase [Nannocystaceae bacterium]
MTEGPERRGRERLDKLMVERGLCESRARAQALIVAARVVVGEHTETKAGTMLPRDAAIRVRGEDHGFVSRGGLKLQGALEAFAAAGLAVAGRVAIDVGASTGGFTDCLLQAGVARVYAVDVGYGQLAWKIATDPRVVAIERQNIRTLGPAQIGEPIDVAVIDCSFISLTKVLPAIPRLLAPGADVVALIKPQFEVGRGNVGKGGIVRDAEARRGAEEAVSAAARELGFEVRERVDSPIVGQKGNVEFLIWLRWPGDGAAS